MRIYLYILIGLFTVTLTGQETSAFDKATEAYAEEDYQAAIDYYQEILDQGKTSTEVYFNLGNSYFRMDEIGPSIYYYNKALQLSPNDADVKNNLLFAEERTIDLIEEAPKTGWKNFWDSFISIFSFNTWAVVAIICLFIFMAFGAWYYFTVKSGKKRLFFIIASIGLIGGILSVIFAYEQFDTQQSKRYAIVFSEESEVHSEPNHNSQEIFTLHEGTKVKVLDNFNGYSKISLADGTIGWIDEQAIKGLWIN